MLPQEEDYRFINCDNPYYSIIRMAYEAKSKRERLLILAFLVQYFEFNIHTGSCGRMDALNAVRYCMRDPCCQDAVWTWLSGLIDDISLYTIPVSDYTPYPSGDGDHYEEITSRLAVSVFCPILTATEEEFDNPYEMVAKDRIMQCYLTPERRWVTLEGFTELTVKEARYVIDKYNQWLEKQNRETIIFDYDELEKYLEDH